MAALYNNCKITDFVRYHQFLQFKAEFENILQEVFVRFNYCTRTCVCVIEIVFRIVVAE